MSAVELENFRESKRKNDAASKQKRVAAMSAVELENYKVSKRNNDAASLRKRHAAKRADSEPVSDSV